MGDGHKLVWNAAGNNPFLPDLPSGIQRHFIQTPGGKLELLSAQPSISSVQFRKRAILFQHGGFGCASVWIPFLDFLAQRGYPCYALSLRGHGGSWKPGFFRMVWGTGRTALCQDIGYAINWIEGFESAKREAVFQPEDLVLVGHSAGGGLVQSFLSEGLGTVGALVIIAGIPCFGGLGVYHNWFKLDPWFVPRYYIRDLWHPRSPLSATSLVHRAFFSPEYPRSEVKKFERMLPEYESMIWPLSQMLPFVNVKNVLKNIIGWKEKTNHPRLFVIAGDLDTLMGVTLMQRMATVYRKALTTMLPGVFPQQKLTDSETMTPEGVDFAIIKDSGHHVQNDLHWEEAAGKLGEFLDHL